MESSSSLAFSHVGLFVTELEPMRSFYTEMLGFTVTDEGELPGRRLTFLSRDPDEHHQIVLASGRPQDLPFNVINQISFRLDSLAELKALHGRLAADSARDLRPVTHGMAWSLYFMDPEDNRIEVFVNTPWYVTQPYSEPFDITRPEQEILSATEVMCRDLPGFKPRAQWRRETAKRMGLEA